MLPFFRRLRQNLLAEGRTLKYLKYAVGEIVLVVIGILIALRINNWNEDQQKDAQRITLLQNLRLDAIATQRSMQTLIAIRKDILKNRRRYLDLAGAYDAEVPEDSLRYYISWAGVKSIEEWPILTTYEAALSSGEIELLQNRSLLQAYNNLQIRNEQRLRLADYHFQSELLYGIRELNKKFGSAERFFKLGPSGDALATAGITLRDAYYDREVYATISTEYDIWTNQVSILSRISEINDSILAVLGKELKIASP